MVWQLVTQVSDEVQQPILLTRLAAVSHECRAASIDTARVVYGRWIDDDKPLAVLPVVHFVVHALRDLYGSLDSSCALVLRNSFPLWHPPQYHDPCSLSVLESFSSLLECKRAGQVFFGELEMPTGQGIGGFQVFQHLRSMSEGLINQSHSAVAIQPWPGSFWHWSCIMVPPPGSLGAGHTFEMKLHLPKLFDARSATSFIQRVELTTKDGANVELMRKDSIAEDHVFKYCDLIQQCVPRPSTRAEDEYSRQQCDPYEEAVLLYDMWFSGGNQEHGYGVFRVNI